MSEASSSHKSKYGSKCLDQIIEKLQRTLDQKKRYEYLLWLGSKLSCMPEEFRDESIKVKGCISQVYVSCELIDGKVFWRGYSDALITKGLLALLIKGLGDLTPLEILAVKPNFIEATGLNASLTPSRANGFLNIFTMMQNQVRDLIV